MSAPILPPPPQRAEILSGGQRFPLQRATFTDLGSGRWRLEFTMEAQEDAMTLVDIIRRGGGSVMLSIDHGPVIGAQTRTRPFYQTLLSQPIHYEFTWP